MKLPELKGTPAQVKWATAIRQNTLDRYPSESLPDDIQNVNDATWWIANRDQEASAPVLVQDFKTPAPYQLVGGPPPPPKGKLQQQIQKGITNLEDYAQRSRRKVDSTDEPHEAELFAASVCHIPILAELALDAAMSRLYIKANDEIGKTMRHRVRLRLERVRDDLIAAIDKDLDGIRRILGKD